jgi:putative Mg2+ transporter-C (MgtC) family protein
MDITFLDLAMRLVVALVFGAVVGWERERKERPAGLRTNMLVALGACGFTLVAMLIMQDYMVNREQQVEIDPAKIIAGIVGGIGFLGAGTIIQSQGNVKGVTTAASLWVNAAVGIAAGAGYFELAALLAGATLFTLVVVRVIEGKAEHSAKDEH